MSSDNWVDYTPDEAFKQAMIDTGIEASELKAKKRDDFRKSAKTPDDIVSQRYARFQESRVRKLFTITEKRKEILSRVAKQPCPPKKRRQDDADESANKEDGVSETSRSHSNKEKDAMLERAHHQRRVWDIINERQQQSYERRSRVRKDLEEQAAAKAEKDRKQREEEALKLEALQRENQETLKARWQNDDKLAAARQQRVDEETETRITAWKHHIDQVNTARERRNAHLEEIMKIDSSENTQARVQRAKALRIKTDEDIADRTRASIAKAEKRREEHVFVEFMRSTNLANRALEERRQIEAALDRAQTARNNHTQYAQERVARSMEKAERALAEHKAQQQEKRRAFSGERQHAHESARDRRRETEHQRENARLEHEREMAAKAEEKRQQKERAEALRREQIEAKRQQQAELLGRVARSTQARQDASLRKFEERQQNVDSRLAELQQIRSVLSVSKQ